MPEAWPQKNNWPYIRLPACNRIKKYYFTQQTNFKMTAEQFKKWRINLGFTQHEWGFLLNHPFNSTVSKIESGTRHHNVSDRDELNIYLLWALRKNNRKIFINEAAAARYQSHQQGKLPNIHRRKLYAQKKQLQACG